MNAIRTKMGAGGRIVIPAEYRKAMGIEPGDPVTIYLDEDGLRVLTTEQAVRRAQQIVRRYVPEGVSLVDELIAERRAEAARE
ncbi:MAG: AbrB/MazE/SpoVT family DNA-binding domain-containing protein [Chloroflexota bacterium]